MYCKDCGIQLVDDAKFCKECGSRTLTRTAQAPTQPVPTQPQPKAEVVQPTLLEKRMQLPPAGFWIRLGAFSIDYFLICVMTGLLAYALVPEERVTDAIVIIVSINTIIYFTVSTGMKSTTIGKRVLGLIVVKMKNRTRVTYGQAFIRTLSYIVSFVTLFLGFLNIAWTKDKRGWHDYIAKTQVIRYKKLNPAAVIIAVLATLFILYYGGSGFLGGFIEGYGSGRIFGTPALITELSPLMANVFCEVGNPRNPDSYKAFGGGSGTMYEDGYVLTNAHVVVPQDKTGDVRCYLVFEKAGAPGDFDIYEGVPTGVSGDIERYDLAFIEITGPVLDENSMKLGAWPRSFIYLNDGNHCFNYEPIQGEKLLMFGYPAYADEMGSYYVTVTEGIVSNFTFDNFILTSAKIDSGNSGGGAFDENGCFVGVPTSVYAGDFESAGIIISVDLIGEYFDAAAE